MTKPKDSPNCVEPRDRYAACAALINAANQIIDGEHLVEEDRYYIANALRCLVYGFDGYPELEPISPDPGRPSYDSQMTNTGESKWKMIATIFRLFELEHLEYKQRTNKKQPNSTHGKQDAAASSRSKGQLAETKNLVGTNPEHEAKANNAMDDGVIVDDKHVEDEDLHGLKPEQVIEAIIVTLGVSRTQINKARIEFPNNKRAEDVRYWKEFFGEKNPKEIDQILSSKWVDKRLERFKPFLVDFIKRIRNSPSTFYGAKQPENN